MGALNSACTAVDSLAYRPVVVLLTKPLPRWWRCDLARLSMHLDDRWDTGYWSGESAPAAPGGLCDACRRRTAIFETGARSADDPDYIDPDDPDVSDSYLLTHAITLHLCGWCRIDNAPIGNADELARALSDARSRSIAWRWTAPV